MAKIVAISDTHGHMPDLPDGDILIVAGDMFPITSHEDHFQRNFIRKQFFPWLEMHYFDHIVWVPGNHDYICQTPGFWRIVEEYQGDNLHFLIDKAVNIEGINFYGFPWVDCPGWAFNCEIMMPEKTQYIPVETDILVSHGPPYNILDNKFRPHGCPHLAARLQQVLPNYHIFGHTHTGRGVTNLGEIIFMNVSYVNGKYEPNNQEIEVFDFSKHID